MLDNFRIGPASVSVEADFALQWSAASRRFACAGPGAVRCVCRSVPELCERPGRLAFGSEHLLVRQTADGFDRYFLMHAADRRPYLLASEQGEEVRLSYAASELPWSAQAVYFWPALGLSHALISAGAVLLHCSYISAGGGAILFAAASGMGKTTQAELWKRCRGAAILNGDRAAVGLRDGRAFAFGVPVSGSSSDCEAADLPLLAVVILSQSAENAASRLGGGKALAAAAANSSVDTWRPGEYAAALEILADVVSAVPVFSLACRPDEGAVRALERALAETEAGR